jgi:hypothetical protein
MFRKSLDFPKLFSVAVMGVCCFVAISVMASDTYPNNTELESLIAEIERLDQALYNIENEQGKNGQNIAPTNTEDTISQVKKVESPTEGVVHYKSDDFTDQDKLIAMMAERIKESAGLANQDYSVVVAGASFSHQEKLLLKDFVEGIRGQLSRITGIKLPSSAYRISIAGVTSKEKQENADRSRYKISIVPDAMPQQNSSTIRIVILNPKAMDSHEFAENVIRGYLALYTYVLRDANYNGQSTELPRWFIKGLARQVDFSSKQEDINDVLSMWSKAYLPLVEVLTVNSPLLTQSNDALAAAVVGFWLSYDNLQERVKTLFTKLANGEEWAPKLYSETLKPNTTALELDRGFDFWLLAQRFRVLKIGSSSEALARRIFTHLTFVPESGPDWDASNKIWVALPPADLVKYKDEPWAKKLAQKNIRFLLATSAGRNDAFRTAAAELVSFYEAIVDGKTKEEELYKKYFEAEEKLFSAISKGEE